MREEGLGEREEDDVFGDWVAEGACVEVDLVGAFARRAVSRSWFC